jgi:hypothetical protein
VLYAYLITCLAQIILSLQQLWYYFVYPNPPCQLSLREETRATGENPRLSAERWLILFTWVRSENRTHDLRGERHLLWRLRPKLTLTTAPEACSDDCARSLLWRLCPKLALTTVPEAYSDDCARSLLWRLCPKLALTTVPEACSDDCARSFLWRLRLKLALTSAPGSFSIFQSEWNRRWNGILKDI